MIYQQLRNECNKVLSVAEIMDILCRIGQFRYSILLLIVSLGVFMGPMHQSVYGDATLAPRRRQAEGHGAGTLHLDRLEAIAGAQTSSVL